MRLLRARKQVEVRHEERYALMLTERELRLLEELADSREVAFPHSPDAERMGERVRERIVELIG